MFSVMPVVILSIHTVKGTHVTTHGSVQTSLLGNPTAFPPTWGHPTLAMSPSRPVQSCSLGKMGGWASTERPSCKILYICVLSDSCRF